jgi:hypothetical protein
MASRTLARPVTVGQRALETEAQALTNLSHTPEDKVDLGHKSRTVRK